MTEKEGFIQRTLEEEFNKKKEMILTKKGKKAIPIVLKEFIEGKKEFSKTVIKKANEMVEE